MSAVDRVCLVYNNLLLERLVGELPKSLDASRSELSPMPCESKDSLPYVRLRKLQIQGKGNTSTKQACVLVLSHFAPLTLDVLRRLCPLLVLVTSLTLTLIYVNLKIREETDLVLQNG